MVAEVVVEAGTDVGCNDDTTPVLVLDLELVSSLELLSLAAAAVIWGRIVEGSLKKSSSEACEDERPVLKSKCISSLIMFAKFCSKEKMGMKQRSRLQ